MAHHLPLSHPHRQTMTQKTAWTAVFTISFKRYKRGNKCCIVVISCDHLCLDIYSTARESKLRLRSTSPRLPPSLPPRLWIRAAAAAAARCCCYLVKPNRISFFFSFFHCHHERLTLIELEWEERLAKQSLSFGSSQSPSPATA